MELLGLELLGLELLGLLGLGLGLLCLRLLGLLGAGALPWWSPLVGPRRLRASLGPQVVAFAGALGRCRGGRA